MNHEKKNEKFFGLFLSSRIFFLEPRVINVFGSRLRKKNSYKQRESLLDGEISA